MSETRMPTQKRSIEKRNRIIEKGFELMCEKGYYNTNTAEIAEYAGVSTGIVYQYFNDKEEIFLEGVENYFDNLINTLIEFLENSEIKRNNIDKILNDIINLLIKGHNISKKAHNELTAMSHLNSKVDHYYKDQELEVTKKIVTILENNNIYIDNAFEKVHIIYGMIDNLCHEIIYHNHNEMDYDIMKKEVINIAVNIIK